MSQCFNPHCGKINPQGQKFCSNCGTKLLLADRYLATAFLGQGGFGRTFKAVDQYRLQTPCVIKQFLPSYQGTKALEKAKILFEQEAIQLCELGKHPQIPDLLAFFEQEGRLYLVQELIEGEDLFQELQKKGRYSEEEIKDFLLQLLPVLQFIHEKNVIHRDIKPENIVRRNKKNQSINITENAQTDLVLIDFGVSKQITGIGQVGTITGTYGYAAPEQMRGMAEPASDLYSLALSAIRLLTGCLPVEENGVTKDPLFNFQEMTWLWQEWLQQHQIEISPKLAFILDKMLQEKVSDRFANAQEIIEILTNQENQIKESNSLTGVINNYWQKTVQFVENKLNKKQNSPPAPITTPSKSISKNLPTPPPAKTVTPKPSPPLPQNFGTDQTQPPQQKLITSVPREPLIAVTIKSSLGINYLPLKQLLTQQKWKEADIETYKLLLKISGRQAEGWLRPSDVGQLASLDLQTINNLWKTYSQERFCFSTQKAIYQILGGGGIYDEKIWQKFVEQLGWFQEEKWLNYSELNFTLNAPLGHLPFGGWLYRLQNVNRPIILINLLLRSDF